MGSIHEISSTLRLRLGSRNDDDVSNYTAEQASEAQSSPLPY